MSENEQNREQPIREPEAAGQEPEDGDQILSGPSPEAADIPGPAPAGPVEPMPPEYQEPMMPSWSQAQPPQQQPPQQQPPQQGWYYPPQGGQYQPWQAYQQPQQFQQPQQPPQPDPYGQYGQQPGPGAGYPYPQQGYAQPQACPGQGYYPQPPYPGQPYPNPCQWQAAQGAGASRPPKQKMSGKVKLFLWILGVLTAVMLGIFLVYLAMAAGNSSGSSRNPFFGYSEPFDGGDKEDEEEPPQSMEPEEEDAAPSEPPRPQVDVTPNTEGIQIQARPQGDTLDAESVYNRVVPSTVTVSAELEREGQTSESTGTGIIATSDGYIITNSHVVLNSKSSLVTVTTYDGQEYEAVVVGVDRTTDLAVLKTNDHSFLPAEFGDASQLSVGEWVMAIGNPGGARFSSSLTRGIISGLDREVGKYSENGMTYIQTDAAINPGNSGGPLVNMYGQVVGINSSKIITEGYEGMGFAIPVSSAQPIINELLSGGYIKGRTRLGIMCREVNSAMAQMTGMPRGLMISAINEDSGFAGSGAREGDIITAIDGEKVESLREVSNLLLRYEPGDQVKVTLYRPGESLIGGGQELEVTITLLEDKGETQD